MKICSKCKVEKEETEFYAKSGKPGKLLAHCKICDNLINKIYISKNKEEIAAQRKVYRKKYYEENREKCAARQKIYDRRRKVAHRDSMNEKRRLIRATNPIIRLKDIIRCRMRDAFSRRHYIKTSRTELILGCSFKDLESHLIQTAIKNYGTYDNALGAYEIDHITPLAIAKSIEDVKKLNHYTNLQYLTPPHNKDKAAKLDWVLPDWRTR